VFVAITVDDGCLDCGTDCGCCCCNDAGIFLLCLAFDRPWLLGNELALAFVLLLLRSMIFTRSAALEKESSMDSMFLLLPVSAAFAEEPALLLVLNFCCEKKSTMVVAGSLEDSTAGLATTLPFLLLVCFVLALSRLMFELAVTVALPMVVALPIVEVLILEDSGIGMPWTKLSICSLVVRSDWHMTHRVPGKVCSKVHLAHVHPDLPAILYVLLYCVCVLIAWSTDRTMRFSIPDSLVENRLCFFSALLVGYFFSDSSSILDPEQKSDARTEHSLVDSNKEL